MKKEIIYKYLGTNGIIESPVHLEDIYYIRLVRLIASKGYKLTDGERMVQSIRVPEEEVSQWIEVKDLGQS